MKFLHLVGSMNPQTGGPCQGIRNLAPWFEERGDSVEVLCFDDPIYEGLSSEAFPIHSLGPGWGSWNYHPKLLSWLNQNLSRFDVAIAHGLWQYHGYALSKAALRPEMPPRLVFPHGMLDPWFQRLSIRPGKALRNWIYWKLIEHRVANQADALLFTCQEEQRLARCAFHPYRPKKEVVVGLGIPDPPVYDVRMKRALAEKCPRLGEARYLLFLGRIHPKKGVDLLIKAYSALWGRVTNANARTAIPNLLIAGPGLETTFGRRMEEMASRICPPGSVLWPGMLSGEAKWGALYNAEAFVLSSHQENFGIAVVEALACKRPALISRKINIWREIEADRAGLVEDDTLVGTQNLLRRWRDLDTKDIASMKVAARSSYENRFHIALSAQSLVTAASEVRRRRGLASSPIKASYPQPTLCE